MMHSTWLTPLLAADVEWLKLVVPFVMFTIYALNRLLGGDAAAKKKLEQRQAANKPPPPAPAAPPDPQRRRVEDEVGEFLRRASQQRKGKEDRPAPPGQPPRSPKAPRPRLGEANDGRRELPPYADVVSGQSAVPGAAKARTVNEVVEAHLGRRDRADRAVGSKEIDQADESMEQHLQQAFGHQVGQLADGASPVATAGVPLSPDTASAEIAALLRNPASVRDAIIVSEILRRPVDRW